MFVAFGGKHSVRRGMSACRDVTACARDVRLTSQAPPAGSRGIAPGQGVRKALVRGSGGKAPLKLKTEKLKTF